MIVGIDPGKTGAIAFLQKNGDLVKVHDMPVMAHGKTVQVNGSALSSMFSLFVGGTVYLERVSAMPKQGVAGVFNFGMGYGVIQGVLAARNIPFVLVTPQAWKKSAGLIGKPKDNGRTLAQQLYPQAPLSRVKDGGRADAILIARFGGGI